MNDLDDLSICKRIAEIEGYEFESFQVIMRKHGAIYGHVDYNPLTDDALCFRLMKKHRIDLEFEDLECPKVRADYCIEDKNPNRAICLAIIEVHNV